ncbi:MAG: hypothetical protein WD737_02295 [Gemmatimonadota bacterium]
MRAYDYDLAYRRGGRRRQPVPPESLAGWYPGAYMAEAPMYGWGWWGGALGWPPYSVARYDSDHRRRRPRPPRESPMFGRAADRQVREWAERHGYDLEMSIRPEDPPGRTRRGWR